MYWISRTKWHPPLCSDQLVSESLLWPSLSFTTTKVKFGRNRHFMRCDGLTNSLERFLELLSEAIGISRTAGIG